MNDSGTDFGSRWQAHLEVIGPALFQRYRKRLMQPGITWEIQRDYPGLSLPDVMIRVHAGRRIIGDGQDFVALRAIRSGSWQQTARPHRPRQPRGSARRDRLSRFMVTLGGRLFGAYCLASLATTVGAGAGVFALSGL